MDEIISTLISEEMTKDNVTYAAPEHRSYMRDRIAELDEEYIKAQKRLLMTVKNLRHKKERELEPVSR